MMNVPVIMTTRFKRDIANIIFTSGSLTNIDK